MILTIAIPTFNRARRLEKGLLDLLKEINTSLNKSDIAVLVSNNGSTDETEGVIARCREIYLADDIVFTTRTVDCNQGFDSNVLACYAISNSKYVWFLSDDDNIIPGSIDLIIEDIKCYRPSIIYYNHNQEPFTNAHPHIQKLEFFDQITSSNITALQKIIRWPKLTSIVIKKCLAGLKVPNQDSWFAHVTLALQCGLAEGGVLHSPVFTSYPDDDFRENINFPPYIGNDLDISIRWVLQANNKMHFYNELSPGIADPLISSLNTLGAYYRGRHAMPNSLKCELWKKVKCEIKSGWMKRILDWNSVKELVKFPISLAYGIGYSIIKGKKITKER